MNRGTFPSNPGRGAGSRRPSEQGFPIGFQRMMDPPGGPLRPTERQPGFERASSGGHEEAAPEPGLYIISVAARIVKMHPQTLRKYERLGMITPTRTIGMLRLYSEMDIARLRLIKHLVSDLGLNIAGARLALGLFNRLVSMRGQISRVEDREIQQLLDDSLARIMELLEAGMTQERR